MPYSSVFEWQHSMRWWKFSAFNFNKKIGESSWRTKKTTLTNRIGGKRLNALQKAFIVKPSCYIRSNSDRVVQKPGETISNRSHIKIISKPMECASNWNFSKNHFSNGNEQQQKNINCREKNSRRHCLCVQWPPSVNWCAPLCTCFQYCVRVCTEKWQLCEHEH